ncbi:EAL domain-containing protein [Bradyrhizobium sp.]|uniref:EAL domain-containing protein n=1 Tax=Bradyrhizobium sp. TaxID=376 RepID=UPI003C70F767
MGGLITQLYPSELSRRQSAAGDATCVADEPPVAKIAWLSRPVGLIIICGILLVGVVMAATGALLLNLRDRDIAENERRLNGLALVLAEQIDRSLQSIEVIQTAVIERMRSLGIESAEDLERQMSGYETHQRFRDSISALPDINALVLTDAHGKLINFSRFWPIPSVKVPDGDPSEVFKSDPRLTFHVGVPLHSPATGNWVVLVARKFTGPNGEFLGVVTGVMELAYFEKIFGAVATSSHESIGLFRRDGTLLARYPRQETAVGQSFSASQVFTEVLSRFDHGSVRETGVIDGKERLISARGLSHFPIAVTVTTTLDEALANWRDGAIATIVAALAIAIVIGVVVTVCTWLVGRKFREQYFQRDIALGNMSQGLIMFNSAAQLVVCNDRYRQMYNLPRELAKPGCPVIDLLNYRVANGTFSADPEKYVGDIKATITHGKTTSIEVKTGDGRTISVVHQPIAGGGWVTTHEDVTERKLAEEQLRRTQKFLDTVVEHVPVPILVKDMPSSANDASQCRYSLVNRAGEELFDVSRSQMIGKTVDEIYPKERAEFVIAEANKTLRSHQPTVVRDHEIHISGKGTRLVTAKSIAVRGDDGKVQYLLTVLDDMTERKRTEQRIAHMAHYDNLTDLPNRAAFNECFAATLDRAAKSGEPFVVLSLDVDHFKEANDSYGHAVGDALLREVARRMQAAAAGTFLARIGGDEFTLIVTDGAQPATAAKLAKRLLASFEDAFEVEGYRLTLNATIGGAVYPTDGTDAKTLMINADVALYRAKAEARGAALFFEPQMGTELQERRALELDLRSAVERDELFLHYQPQKKMSGEAVGFEALVRWQCQKRGMVSPDVFIPVAEESSLIVEMGEWVLREACREAASWSNPLTIAVNISPIQFRQGDLPKSVHSVLLETGLAPARLELEITEGVLIDDFSRAISILARLKSLGVRIALDDFGTGYSSLSYLHSFSFDKIKIDRAFIGDLESSRHSTAIVRAVIDLGHNLDVPILAEGVETDAQHAFLMREGCDEVQGYLTGRPLPIADYAKLVGRRVIGRPKYAAAE